MGKHCSCDLYSAHVIHYNSYDEVEVTNFHGSWKNGMAFCAVLDRHR